MELLALFALILLLGLAIPEPDWESQSPRSPQSSQILGHFSKEEDSKNER